MTPDAAHLKSTLFKVLWPLLGIAAAFGGAFVRARRRGSSWRDYLGLRVPPIGPTTLWLSLSIAWMLVTNYLLHWRGPWDFTIWKNTPLSIDVLRVLAVGVLGPIAEELLIRGLLYTRLVQTRLGVVPTVVILAAAWAAGHIDYSASVIAIIFVFGLLLGTARQRTASVIAPILMHITWNLYAVW